ncbi:MAG TPA: CGNR zinc finger domain-containing protein [Gemmatimonadales bacterium]|nr:CGNR zinc finger domain-containing protein [Gemmatimonadales bacterium]
MPDQEFTLLGDACWLDFVNTTCGRAAAPPDLLPDPAAYHRWSKAGKLVSDVDAVPFEEVLAFRRRLLGLAEALAVGRPAPAPAIAAINAVLAAEGGRERLVRGSGVWRRSFAPDRAATARIAVARSAADTLTDATRHVRRCAGDPCSLFFLDGSPTQSRRWCSAAHCGGRGRIERRRGLLR